MRLIATLFLLLAAGLAGCVTDDGLDTLPDPTPTASGLALPIGEISFEPTIGVHPDGTIFMSTFNRDAPSTFLLRRSHDHGQTWEDVTPEVFGDVTFPPSSNDPYVYVDDTGRVFLSDLQALLCSTLAWSDDKGDTWTVNPIGCGHPFGVHDHQTLFSAEPRTVATIGYDKVVYYCVNRVADSACATSLNGGLTFGPLRPAVFPGVQTGDEAGFCGGLHAHGTAAPDGTVYLPKGHCGKPWVAITKDDGVTWEAVKISDMDIRGHEVAVAVDEGGSVYAFWIGSDLRPYLAISLDGGYTWAEPIMVAPDGVGTTDWPTVTAGAAGHAAFAYYGTQTTKAYDEMDGEDTWNGYIGIWSNGTITTVKVNDDPLARGICGGTRCQGVGDFIDITMAPDGRPWAAFVDVCHDACISGETGANEGGNLGVAGTLDVGPSLLGGGLNALPRTL